MDCPSTSRVSTTNRSVDKTIHFSDHDLYSVIKNNDIAGVEKAVFFMGVRIHVVHIWCGRTALGYAARLGHLEQTEILFRDRVRYFDNVTTSPTRPGSSHDRSDPRNIVGNLLKELLPHFRNCSDFLNRLVDKYEEECASQLISMIREEAFQLVETLAKKNEEKYIPLIINKCFVLGKTSIFQALEWMVKHPAFEKRLALWREKDPLYTAISMRDCAEFTSLLLSVVTDSEPPQYKCLQKPKSSESQVLPFSLLLQSAKRRKLEENPIPRFIHHLIATGDVTLLNAMLDVNVLAHVMRIVKISEEKLLKEMFTIALRRESLEIASNILGHQKFNSSLDWHRLYYQMVDMNKMKAAEFAKPRCCYINQRYKGELYQEFGNNNPILIKSGVEHQPADVIISLVDRIDSLPRNQPNSNSKWRQAVTHFPWANGRPDLAESFAKYGFRKSEKEVSENMAVRAFRSEYWDKQAPRISISSVDADLEYAFLSEGGLPRVVRIGSTLKITEHVRSILTDCVIQTGKSLQVPAQKFVTYMDPHSTKLRQEALDMVQEIETQRIESMSLKRLCRIVIRHHTREMNSEKERFSSNPRVKLTYALQCLYVDGHLPRDIVKFLLYREENVRQPLYYRLVKPDRSGNYGCGKYGMYESDPESDDNCYYYSSGDDYW